ncbi:hypothetical protein QAD02_018604, partial [Eretmocerus hayati]
IVPLRTVYNNHRSRRLLTMSLTDQQDCPRIISRSEWHARDPVDRNPLVISPAPFVVVHHGGINHYCKNETSCADIVRSYQNLHMDKNGWWDIGYNFVIGEDGNIYEGRGWDTFGAHAPKYNNQSIGVSVIGDFTKVMPNEAALEALNSLIKCGLSMNKIRADYHVIGHRQGRATECPGETFYKYVQKMPHWMDHPIPIKANR